MVWRITAAHALPLDRTGSGVWPGLPARETRMSSICLTHLACRDTLTTPLYSSYLYEKTDWVYLDARSTVTHPNAYLSNSNGLCTIASTQCYHCAASLFGRLPNTIFSQPIRLQMGGCSQFSREDAFCVGFAIYQLFNSSQIGLPRPACSRVTGGTASAFAGGATNAPCGSD